MFPIDLDHVLTVLGAAAWTTEEQSRARVASALALAVYDGHTRDQGTPYLEHPLAVVTLLRTETGVSHPETLLLALLHDALEVAPESEALLIQRLGAQFTSRLREMTPDHRLEQRSKATGDEPNWRFKQAALPAEDLLVRLTDRLHNLRDLAASPNLDRRRRFLRSLEHFYLPLAEAARGLSPQLETMHTLLHSEYVRHQREVRP
ncbi:HD domain-containing protein [Streptomyces acidiscabies]|uniref:HD domain-containing protein n=1 Tax=Streptomyces acidiscabies TaxID=42234 RepID=A0AAP6EL14_9ACTN|nr:HD domain-containing protein [Streptomyces acidiscabies]MBP5937920.1 HD domain-containing protein [Streptomyces sp. LBUM 1476]MBZ3908921.1 HD domain-containing protein [Streptomyces acidiscabies]MDX2966573.1 HD domain-containing protein [Streptomyces acidiscabies]MDX3016672.1 HD domain-containing protein [Streptomyces acidiscabies]MDX3788420.1 HD domain-containing protein [Streptomyces acidiscabies]